MLQNFEKSNNITERWTPDSEEWKHAASYLAIREYQMALDKLEGLVVQRLFELAKMGLSGTGKCVALLEIFAHCFARLQDAYAHQ